VPTYLTANWRSTPNQWTTDYDSWRNNANGD